MFAGGKHNSFARSDHYPVVTLKSTFRHYQITCLVCCNHAFAKTSLLFFIDKIKSSCLLALLY